METAKRIEAKGLDNEADNSHGGYAGKSLIERIQSLLDRQNKQVKSLAKG